MTLSLVAHIRSKPEHLKLVKAELIKLIDITRAEKGCINYDLHQDHENPNHFMFYENWETRELWQEHMNAPHLTAYQEATKDAVEFWDFYEMQQIEA